MRAKVASILVMREKVCIVLNEREPSKARAAESLIQRLKEYGITASRLEIGKDIEKLVLERLPNVLVLDYLLGDYSTGLDVLGKISDVHESKRPKTFFLTDEPSVPVAVEAMRLGCINYYELDHPQAINHLAHAIDSVFKNKASSQKAPSERKLKLDDLVAHSHTAQSLIQDAKLISKKFIPIVVIHGPHGAGLSTIARCLQTERQAHTLISEIDLATFEGRFADLCSRGENLQIGVALGSNLSLIVDNAEEDDGDIIQYTAKHYRDLWPGESAKHNQSYLTLLTNCEETARAWKKLANAHVLKVAPLSEREEDLAPLVQRFMLEASDLAHEKLKSLPVEIITWLVGLDWPGNIKQLRAVVVDLMISLSLGKEDLKDLAQRKRSEWEAENQPQDSGVTSFAAAMCLDFCNHSYRLAAAKLGVSVKKLRELTA